MLRYVLLLTLCALSFCAKPPVHHSLLSRTAKIRTVDKLSGEVTPISYTLQFRLDEDFNATNAFTGITTINLNIGNITNEPSTFQLHAKDLDITSLTLTLDKEPINVTYSTPEGQDILTVLSHSKLEPSESYKLVIEYNGTISDTSMVGAYKSTYTDPFKQKKYLVATQFEEIHARKAFPCFDEPAMKAAIDIYITYPKAFSVFSNNAVAAGTPSKDPNNPNLQKIHFKALSPMSTYLVAFIVAEWYCKDGDSLLNSKNQSIPIQLCSRISAFDTSAEIALNTAPKVLNTMTQWTNYAYDLPKLTLAAIPDFAPGAMENWGLVTFREADLLWYKDDSSNYDKQTVVTVVTHELSHQWFGDLVTLNWWNEMFLNEGFATYFEYHAAAEIEPSWELGKQFVIEQVQSALEDDSHDNSLPLSYDVNDADYSSRTNDVSYNKGASVLRMVSHFITDENFKQALAEYIGNNSLSTATSEILWSTLDRHIENAENYPADIPTIMENWTKESGYPLVTVKSSGDDIIVSQEPFLKSENNRSIQWYIPLIFTSSTGSKNFQDTSVKAWLIPDNNTILSGVLDSSDNTAWFVLNNQQTGYYRVNYDDNLLQRISNVLNSNVTIIDEISRAELIDDQFSFAKAEKRAYGDVFDFLSFLKKDDSYYPWYSAFNGFDYCLQHIENSELRAAYMKYINEHMEALLVSVPLEQENSDDHIYTLKQVMAWSWACKLNNENCISISRQKFVDYMNDATLKPGPNIRTLVYCNGLRQSVNPNAEFQFLWDNYQETQIATERIAILKALGCINDTFTRLNYLKMALTDEEIRRQDVGYALSSVYSNNPTGVTEVLNFLIDNYQTFIERFGGISELSSFFFTLAKRITNKGQFDKIIKFAQTDELDSDLHSVLTDVSVDALSSFTLSDNLEETLGTYLHVDLRSGAYFDQNHFVTILILLVGCIIFNY